MQKISPFLWFDGNAEQAVKFYTSIFPKSKVLQVARYGQGGPGKPGTVMTVNFRILGQEFTALNGGPQFKFSPATSFVVKCETQREVDYYWKKLSAGGKPSQCGWLDDRFGLSWQVVPTVLYKFVADKNPERSERVIAAMLNMVKFDLKGLQRAYDGK